MPAPDPAWREAARWARVTAETGLREEDLRLEQQLPPGPDAAVARHYLAAARYCLLDGLYCAAGIELRDAARAVGEARLPVTALLARLSEATAARTAGHAPPSDAEGRPRSGHWAGGIPR